MMTLISIVALTFFAYAGFGIMANAAANVDNPPQTLPRAILAAIGLPLAAAIATPQRKVILTVLMSGFSDYFAVLSGLLSSIGTRASTSNAFLRYGLNT